MTYAFSRLVKIHINQVHGLKQNKVTKVKTTQEPLLQIGGALEEELRNMTIPKVQVIRAMYGGFFLLLMKNIVDKYMSICISI